LLKSVEKERERDRERERVRNNSWYAVLECTSDGIILEDRLHWWNEGKEGISYHVW
jgi:hypothetical protein